MPVMYIDEAAAHAGQEVTIRGWLRSRRDKGKLHFLIVRDGTGGHSGGCEQGDGG